MCIWFMFYLCREKNKTLFWANKALFYRLRKRNANRNIKKTASSRNFWICREYAFCLRIWSRLCMHMRRPVQDGLYCESLWNPANVYNSLLLSSQAKLDFGLYYVEAIWLRVNIHRPAFCSVLDKTSMKLFIPFKVIENPDRSFGTYIKFLTSLS